MKLLATARFSDTVVQLSKLAQANPQGLPEVAFVGRSNAGKSSCINLICNRRRLAFSSRTPGRTQALNLFAVGPTGSAGSFGLMRDDEREAPPVGYLVDTPGYGFAAAAPSAKRSWQALAGDYIRQRGPLVGVVLMVDIRRLLTDLDRQLLSWVPPDIALIIVMTKADKLGRQQARQAMRKVAQDPLLAGRHAFLLVTLFSTLSRTGVEDLQLAVESLMTGVPVEWAKLPRHPGETAPIIRMPPALPSSPPSSLPPALPADPTAPAGSAQPDHRTGAGTGGDASRAPGAHEQPTLRLEPGGSAP
jgi:GTP-binding protein